MLKFRRLVLIFLAIIVVIAGGYHSILQSDVFLLEEIIVKENNRIPKETIITASGLQIGVDKIPPIPPFPKVGKGGFSDEEMEKKLLQKFIYIKHVDIKKQVPGTLIIEIVERKPVAIIPFQTANRNVYGLMDIEGFILELVDEFETPADIIILTDVLKEKEERNIFIENKDLPLLLDDFLSSYLSKKLDQKSISIAQNTLMAILKSGECRGEMSIDSKHIEVVTLNLYSKILSINTKNANKITLKLRDDSVVLLSLDYLEDGLCNFKNVFIYHKNKNKHCNYIDARFEGVVYCGGELNER